MAIDEVGAATRSPMNAWRVARAVPVIRYVLGVAVVVYRIVRLAESDAVGGDDA